jgi:hypothetical protein
MLLPGNGTTSSPLGDVVNTEINIPLIAPVCEKITAVLKANSVNYWVIAHGWNNNNFYIYEVTPMGVNTTPIITSIGNIHAGGSGNLNSVGYMKTSPFQNKLALVNRNNTSIDVYDFNNATGVVSNQVSIPMPGNVLYGIEFSMSGSYLYVENKDTLCRYEFSTGVLQGILIDNMSVFSNTNIAIRAMQMGPDGKIYVSIRDHDYLSVISNPDAPVTQLTVDGIFLDIDGQGRKCTFGLPTLFYYKGWCDLPAPTIDPADTITFCSGESITLTSSPAYSYLWSDSSTTQSITVTTPGNYTVTISDAFGCMAFSVPSVLVVTSPPAPFITLEDGMLQSTPAYTYQWYLNGTLIGGAVQQSFLPMQTGNYTVMITDSSGCSATSSSYYFIYGIIYNGYENSVTIYQNPGSNRFLIKIPAGSNYIQIFNTSGQLVRSLYTGNKTVLDFTLPVKGIYFIRVSTDKYSITKKLPVYR